MTKKRASTSTTTEPLEPGDPSELAGVRAQVDADVGAIAPAPEPAPSPEDELIDVAEEKLDELRRHPEDVEKLVALLTEEELASVIELGFGLAADSRGAHWEITEKRSLRIAKWLKLSLDKHPGLLKWIASFLPELVTSGLVAYEIWKRVQQDRVIAKKKKEQQVTEAAP